METKQNDYKPFSKRMYFVLNYKCINRECNIETTTHQEIDLMRVCLKCNDKHPHFMLKTFHDQFKKGLEEWENSRGLKLTKTCSNDFCKYQEHMSFTYKSLIVSKSCNRCGMVTPLISLNLGNILFKLNEPIKYSSFDCDKCNSHWKTTCYWWGYKQSCEKCKQSYFPTDISCEFYNVTQPVVYKAPTYKEMDKNHIQKNCEKCVQIGKPCFDISKELIKEITDRREEERNKILGIKPPEEKKKEEEKKGKEKGKEGEKETKEKSANDKKK
jgi:hypothetical protein